MSASHAGAFNAHAPLNTKIVTNNEADVASFVARIVANAATNKAMNDELRMRKRLKLTTSAIAPPSIVSKNIGSTVAIWTSDTVKGSGLSDVISHAQAASNVAIPMRATVLAVHIRTKSRCPKALKVRI